MARRVWLDASALIATASIGFLDRLLKVVGPAHATRAVLAEALQEGRPGTHAIREAVAVGRIAVVDAEGTQGRLGPGEASLLAAATPPDLLVLDDREARHEARSRGFRVAGTLAILVHDCKEGLLTPEEATRALDALAAGDFRMAVELYAWALRRIEAASGARRTG